MMARVPAYYASTEMDDVPAEFARGVARHVFSQIEGDPDQPLLVRCVRYLDTAAREDISPERVNELDLEELYAADAWRDSEGRIQVLKRSPASQAAPVILPPDAER